MMPDENVFDVLPRIRKERPKLPIIVMSAQNTLLTAVNAADAGAFEYVSKPFDLDDVTAAARRALSRPADAEASKAQARAMRDERLPLIGRSAPMQEVYRTIARLVGADLTVLILGESGTGKELVARALHELGPYVHPDGLPHQPRWWPARWRAVFEKDLARAAKDADKVTNS